MEIGTQLKTVKNTLNIFAVYVSHSLMDGQLKLFCDCALGLCFPKKSMNCVLAVLTGGIYQFFSVGLMYATYYTLYSFPTSLLLSLIDLMDGCFGFS